MITGAHFIVYSKNPKADRAFFQNVLMLPYSSIVEGWLVFGLPRSECAVHQWENNTPQELYLICDEIEHFVSEMKHHKIMCTDIQQTGWGLLTHLTLPGGGRIGVYEPLRATRQLKSPKQRKSVRSIRKIGGRKKT